MEHYGKSKRIYHGIIIPFIVMIVLQVGLYFLFYYAIKQFSKQPDFVIANISLGFAGLIGVLFEIICVIHGFIYDPFVAFLKRVGNLFANFKIFKKKALAWYWDDFKENGGIIIWVFLLIFLATLFVCIFGFTRFAIWYQG